MNSVERVKSICKERKIPFSRLEKDLGFGNGYINQLKKGSFPDDRLAKIASYLSVSVEYLLTGVETEKAPPVNGERISKDELKAAFFQGEEGLSKEEQDALWDDAWEFYQFKLRHLKQKRNKNESEKSG